VSWSLKIPVYIPPSRPTLRMRTHYASNERKDQPPSRPYVRICEISTTLFKYLSKCYLNFVSRLFFHPTSITCQIVFSVSQLFTSDVCPWSLAVVGRGRRMLAVRFSCYCLSWSCYCSLHPFSFSVHPFHRIFASHFATLRCGAFFKFLCTSSLDGSGAGKTIQNPRCSRKAQCVMPHVHVLQFHLALRTRSTPMTPVTLMSIWTLKFKVHEGATSPRTIVEARKRRFDNELMSLETSYNIYASRHSANSIIVP